MYKIMKFVKIEERRPTFYGQDQQNMKRTKNVKKKKTSSDSR